MSIPAGLGEQVRYAAVRLVAGGATLYLALAVIGVTYTRLFTDSAVERWDVSVARDVAARRTPAWDARTHLGSSLSDTSTAIGLTVVLVVLLRWGFGRWRESVTLLLSILGELFVFLLVTNTVRRDRPPVPRLDPAPPTSSFPSGHVGAAVALYAGLAVILLLSTRGGPRHRLAVLVAPLLFAVPVVVALSRVYRGMHYVTDVVFGAVAGGLWMLLVVRTVLLAVPERARPDGGPPTDRAGALG